MSGLVPLTAGIFGLAIVISLAVAALIKAIVVALPLLQRRLRPRAPAQAVRPAAAALPEAHLAAITGALAACLGEHHIVHIEDRGRGAVWTAEGRLLHQTSHSVPHSPKR
jgi:hypothetical protein